MLVVVGSTIVGAGALITGSSGSVVQLNPAPPSVKLNALENATKVYAFDEAQGVTLSAAVAVDGVNPGTYTSFPNGTAKVAAGTVVDSHLIHSDIPSRNYTARRTGSVTFGNTIVGVIASTASLAASDNLGAPGTLYAGTTQWRGLESGEFGSSLGDKFTISADGKTLSFDIQTYVMDEIRVLTAPSTQLTTTIADSPDPVTAGNDVQYTLTVTNSGTVAVANAHVVDTLPAGTTLSRATPPAVAPVPARSTARSARSRSARRRRPSSSSPARAPCPAGGTITNTAVASPGSNPVGDRDHHGRGTGRRCVEGLRVARRLDQHLRRRPGHADPAELRHRRAGRDHPGRGHVLRRPVLGDGHRHLGVPRLLGPEPADPPAPRVHVPGARRRASRTRRRRSDRRSTRTPTRTHPNVGSPVPFCSTLGAGVAVPHPCVDARAITQPSPNSFEVTLRRRSTSRATRSSRSADVAAAARPSRSSRSVTVGVVVLDLRRSAVAVTLLGRRSTGATAVPQPRDQHDHAAAGQRTEHERERDRHRSRPTVVVDDDRR